MSRNWRTNKNYVTIGDWSWDNVLFQSKIVHNTDPNACTTWLGSMSPTGALFGAKKHGSAQMTQARRLAWMAENNADVTPYRLAMLCNNQACLNTRHFQLFPNNKRSKDEL